MKTWMRRHPFMKVFSLLLAFVLWLMVRAEQYTEVNLNVKVQTKNVPENMVIAGDVEPDVRVQISGPRTRLKQLQERTFEPLVIDLAEAKQGINAFTIYAEDFQKLPRGARVTRIFPQIIKIALDQAEEQLVRVEPVFIGTLDEGYELVVQSVNPAYLKIRGARSDLEAISSIKTVPILLTGKRQSFQGEFALRGLRPQWALDNKRVTVNVTIRRRS